MASLTMQRAEVKSAINTLVEKYLTDHPGDADVLARAACNRLANKMNVKELQNWQRQLELLLEE